MDQDQGTSNSVSCIQRVHTHIAIECVVAIRKSGFPTPLTEKREFGQKLKFLPDKLDFLLFDS